MILSSFVGYHRAYGILNRLSDRAHVVASVMLYSLIGGKNLDYNNTDAPSNHAKKKDYIITLKKINDTANVNSL